MSRCIWSGAEGGGRLKKVTVPTVDRLGQPARMQSFLVLPEHEASFRAYSDRVVRLGRTFLVGIFSLLGLTILLSLTGYLWATGIGVTLLGAWILWLPFATPETVRLVGVEKSMLVARAAGVLTALIGVAMVFAP